MRRQDLYLFMEGVVIGGPFQVLKSDNGTNEECKVNDTVYFMSVLSIYSASRGIVKVAHVRVHNKTQVATVACTTLLLSAHSCADNPQRSPVDNNRPNRGIL